MRVPDKFSKTEEGLFSYYHKIAYTKSDIDIFFYGLNENECHVKILKFYNHLKDIHGKVTVLK